MADTAQQGYVCLAKQSAYGVPNTADLAAQQLLVDSHSIGADVEVQHPDPEIGGSRDPRVGAAIFGGVKVTGDIDASLRFHLLPLLLLAAGFVESGAPVEQTTGTGAWRHRFIPGDATPLTILSAWGKDRLVRQWQDCLIDELTVGVDAGDRGTISASILGLNEGVVSAIVPSTPANDAKASWYGSAVVFDGLGTYRWQGANLGIANNLDDSAWVLGSRLLNDITPGEREVTLNGTIRLGTNAPASLTDLYRAAAYGSKTATGPTTLDPYATSGALTLGSSKLIGTSTTDYYRLVATLPSLVLEGFPLEQSGADVLSADITARAYGSAYTLDVYNSRATAY